jgi:hypothetical protein
MGKVKKIKEKLSVKSGRHEFSLSSLAPSSPDPDSSVAVDGGIQTLLKAIELKTLQQVSLPQA